MAYRSDSYGSDNRDRYDRSSAKERSGFAFEQGAELVRSIGKLTKMKLQQGYGEASDSLSGKARKSRHGHGNVDHLKVARDYYREEFEKLKRKVSYFEDQNRDLEDQNRDLEDALRIEQDNVERVRRSANQMQSTMDNRESFLGDQENDNVVETTFLHLMTDIKNWSGRFGGGNAHSLKGEKLQDYQKVFPFCDDFHALENAVAHPKKSRLFVRGWTAYVMCTKLLRSLDLPPVGVVGEDVWIGNTLADSFHCLENRLWFAGQFSIFILLLSLLTVLDRNVVSYKSFNDWRAFTAELLGKAVSIPDDNPTDEARTLVGVAVADVMDVATAWLKNPADLEATEDALYSIFFRAVQFSRVLRRQRALWSVRFPLGSNRGEPGRLRFEPGFMKNYRVEDEDDVEELKSRFVEHIVTPALYKRGTMNGEKFDCEEAIFEAEVGLA